MVVTAEFVAVARFVTEHCSACEVFAIAARAARAHWSVLVFVDSCVQPSAVVASVLDLTAPAALPVCREPVAAAEWDVPSSGCSY